MTVYANKPAFNVREKLKELDYARVPYHKMPAGSVVQVQYAKNITAGSVVNTTSDIVTVSVAKQLSNSKFMIAGGTYLARLSNDANQDGADPTLMFRVDGVMLSTGLSSHAAGTTITFSLALRTNSHGAYYNRSYLGATSNGMTYIQVMEIAQ